MVYWIECLREINSRPKARPREGSPADKSQMNWRTGNHKIHKAGVRGGKTSRTRSSVPRRKRSGK